MSAEKIEISHNKKKWLITIFIIITLLILWSAYKKAVNRHEVVSLNTAENSIIKPSGHLFETGRLAPDMELIEEPGKTNTNEGISMYMENKYENAKDYLERAAEEGNADAKALLGQMYILGRGVVQDTAKGLAHLEDAVKDGSSFAMTELGMLYIEGRHGVEQAFDKGAELINQAIKNGKYYGYLAMAKLYDAGENIEQSTEKAIDYMRQAGEHGYKYAAEEIEKLKAKL